MSPIIKVNKSLIVNINILFKKYYFKLHIYELKKEKKISNILYTYILIKLLILKPL